MSDKAPSVQELADKIKMILANPELIARLAEKDAEDGSVSLTFDELEAAVSKLEKLYPTSE